MSRDPLFSQSSASAAPWRPDMGAHLTPTGVRFRVWAPAAPSATLEIIAPEPAEVPLARQPDGTWEAFVPGLRSGARYRYRLGSAGAFPDPYSRFQPEGVHGPSEVIDPDAYAWQDAGWTGVGIKGLVVYQCHLGTMTSDGTFAGLIPALPRLQRLGIGAIQPLPIAEFPGRWNWGYDGVDLFAPSCAYGRPEHLKALVDAAHREGLAVLLDVVYNHLGPDGNYLRQFSPDYFTGRYQTPWGEALNFDGPGSAWVRKLVLDNALYWIHEYHVDGLRLDATHAIHDASGRHLLAELTDTVRASLPAGRQVVLIAETHENDARYLRPTSEGGFGLDAVWADDFHHVMRRYLVGDHEGYYRDYEGTLAEMARTVEQGWLYEGQPLRSVPEPHGTPAWDRPAWQFLLAIQNHDQVGNRAFGERLHHQVDPARYRVASTVLLLLPYTPLLFMGQEFAASTPFLYFTDHHPELGRLVTEGRRQEFSGFEAFADPAKSQTIPDPQDPRTFLRSKLNVEEAESPPGAQVEALYAELLRLRRTDPVYAAQDRFCLWARALGPDLLLVHAWQGADQRLLLANFGEVVTVTLTTLGPGAERQAWTTLLSTDEARFGGLGEVPTIVGDRVRVPARTAVCLATSHADA